MKRKDAFLLVLVFFILVLIGVITFLGYGWNEEKNKPCISQEQYDFAVSQAQNETAELRDLYESCNDKVVKLEIEKKPINITIDHVWTFVVGFGFGFSLLGVIWSLCSNIWKSRKEKKR